MCDPCCEGANLLRICTFILNLAATFAVGMPTRPSAATHATPSARASPTRGRSSSRRAAGLRPSGAAGAKTSPLKFARSPRTDPPGLRRAQLLRGAELRAPQLRPAGGRVGLPRLRAPRLRPLCARARQGPRCRELRCGSFQVIIIIFRACA